MAPPEPAPMVPRDGEVAAPTMPSPGPSSARHHLLGLGFLLLTLVPAYLASRPGQFMLSGSEEAAAADEDAVKEIDPTEINAHISLVADRYGVSPRLVAAIIEAESEFNPRAVSRRGARGLMQLMPATASSLAVEDSFDPYANIEGGVRHLRRLMDRFRGNLPLVLAAYNAGEQAVVAYRGVPPYRETRRYVTRIMRRLGHAPPPPRSTALKRVTTASPSPERISAAEILRAEPVGSSAPHAPPPEPASPPPPEPRPQRTSAHPRNLEGP